MKDMEKELEIIKKRNNRVEQDKAWETSLTRRLILAVLTYFVIVIFFFSAGLPKPFINSIVPALAYIISTLTFPIFKKIWVKRR